MPGRTARTPLYAAGLTAILAAALVGCASASSGSAGTNGNAPSSPLDAVQLAAKTTSGANSFTGTMSLQATAKSGSAGNVSMTATMAEQLHPSLLADVNIAAMSVAGQTLPGGMAEIITPSALYMKWSLLTQELHQTKPWLEIPVSALSKSSGVNLSQLFSQATNTSPLNESQLLAGATNVRTVGTGTIDGVAVTEYTGTISIDKGMKYLTGSAKAAWEKEVGAAGFTKATFTVWIDASHTMRKAIVVEDGTIVDETVTVSITSINQPVNISVPAADQTSSLPSGGLGGLG